MKKVKFNIVNLSDQKITRNEMKNVSGGSTFDWWCMCIYIDERGWEKGMCMRPHEEEACTHYGRFISFSCDLDASYNGMTCM